MKNFLNTVKIQRNKTNMFDLSHDVKLTCDQGELVPCCIVEAVPGDNFTISCEALTRFAPLVSPVMNRFDLTIHYFFVANRLLWPGWDEWIMNPAPTVVHPYLVIPASATYAQQQVNSYFGLPIYEVGQTEDMTVSALPFAAYQMIYNEYYRDQNLITEVPFELVDGNNTANITELTTLRKRAWEHDYFTASLPFAQKGATVDIPLGQVELDEDSTSISKFVKALDHDDANIGDIEQSGVAPNGSVTIGGVAHVYDPMGTLTVQATSINDLRRASRLQEWLERLARGGSRLTEVIYNFFGVKSADARLQRPEYITGIKTPIVISEVLQMSSTDGTSPQGNMSGHAVGVTSGQYGKYFVQEHGFIFGILSVRPKATYCQGIPRMFLKGNDPFNYYWPQFAHIGEQAVQLQEIFAMTADAEETWGYLPRYSEYKVINNRVAGQMFLDYYTWTGMRTFNTTAPQLNQDFIEVNGADLRTIFAVTDPDVDPLIIHIYNKIKASRQMPKFGTPMF